MLRWIFTNWSTNKEPPSQFLVSPPPHPLPSPTPPTPAPTRTSCTLHTLCLVDEILAKLNVFLSPATLPLLRLRDTSIILADADELTPTAPFSFFDHA